MSTQKSLTEGRIYKAYMVGKSMLGRRSLDDLIGKLDKIKLADGSEIEVFRPVWFIANYTESGSLAIRMQTNFFGRPRYVQNSMVQFCRGDSREKALHRYNNSEFIGKKLYKKKK